MRTWKASASAPKPISTMSKRQDVLLEGFIQTFGLTSRRSLSTPLQRWRTSTTTTFPRSIWPASSPNLWWRLLRMPSKIGKIIPIGSTEKRETCPLKQSLEMMVFIGHGFLLNSADAEMVVITWLSIRPLLHLEKMTKIKRCNLHLFIFLKQKILYYLEMMCYTIL